MTRPWPQTASFSTPRHEVGDRRLGRRILRYLAVATLAIGSAGCFRGVPLRHPSIVPYQLHEQPRSTEGQITVRFLGTTTLLFEDGKTAILSDGFVTRPGVADFLLSRIEPDSVRIRRTLMYLGVDSLAAVFTMHSHYDHAMDAPVFARMTGADLVGSRSTINLGRGFELPCDRLVEIREGEEVSYGNFRLTFIPADHGEPNSAPGRIRKPLKPPAYWKAWKGGEIYSVLIRHGRRSMLIQGSMGFRRNALRNEKTDVVYLSIGGREEPDAAFLDEYWDEVVQATGAKRVILVHWDDFFQDLDEPLQPIPHPRGAFYRIVNHMLERGRRGEVKVEVLLPVAWRPTDPFAGLP